MPQSRNFWPWFRRRTHDGRPRKGRQVAFSREDGPSIPSESDSITGLRFTIDVQNGGEALIDLTALRPRRLALAMGRALRHLAAPGGPLGVRSTVMAYAVAIPKFFAYLADAGEPVAGVETLRARHVDGFEGWLEAGGLTRIHLFTVLAKIVGVLRQAAIDSPGEVSSDLRDRLRYVSAKPFQRSRPRDAYSPFVARQLRDAARGDVTAVLRRLQQVRSSVPDPVLSGMEAAVHAVIEEHGLLRGDQPAYRSLYFARARRGLPTQQLGEELNGRYHLTRNDIVPFLVLLALETGLEIECCKELTVDCLQNASNRDGRDQLSQAPGAGRRAQAPADPRWRVHDAGGMIRRLIDGDGRARGTIQREPLGLPWRRRIRRWHSASAGRWSMRWTRRHDIVDDDGRPLRLLLSHLRKTHKALWYIKTEGHIARFAVGHTPRSPPVTMRMSRRFGRFTRRRSPRPSRMRSQRPSRQSC